MSKLYLASNLENLSRNYRLPKKVFEKRREFAVDLQIQKIRKKNKLTFLISFNVYLTVMLVFRMGAVAHAMFYYTSLISPTQGKLN